MQEIFNFFDQGWVGSLIGVLGVIVATFFFLKSRRIAKPSFQMSSLRLLGENRNNLPNEVTVLFNEKEVDRLTKTTLILWNNGNEVLRGEEVVDTDPVKISFNKGDHILSYEKLRETKEVNEFSVSIDNDNPHQLLIEFSYLDPNDGISLELLHDSEDWYPKVHGSIRGLPKGFEDLGELEADDITLFNRTRITKGDIFPLIGMVMGLGIVVLSLFPSRNWVMLCIGLFCSIINMLVLLVTRKKYPRSLEITK